MPKTAVINPRRDRKGRFLKGGRRRRKNPAKPRARARRRNPSPFTQAAYAGREVNRRRRRGRSYYGSARRRRRNPSSSGITRRSNPSLGLDELLDTVPAATLGVQAARFATRMAGDYEADGPGLGHAIAWWLAATFGGQMVGSLFGSATKGSYATIAALGWAGDQLLWKRFFATKPGEDLQPTGIKKWAAENMYLGDGYYMGGFEETSPIGATEFEDALGNRYVSTPEGWAMGGDGEVYQGADGQLYMGQGYEYPADYVEIMQGVGGFEQTSPIGGGGSMRRGNSTFGYG
jgi:hypothetical protein